MAEIGQTLREARMRRRIDMTEVETATKIRGKYLRALENEEWHLLPGPTFVKSFLRTYAEYLGLDSRLLVEEYRQRFERPSTQDLTAFSPGLGRTARRRRARLAAMGPVMVIVLGIVALLGALYVLGSMGDDETPTEPARVQRTATPTPSGDEGGGSGGASRQPRRRPRVRLQLVATGPVYVCLVDARGRQLIDEETLRAGTRTPTFRSRLFRTNFGNSNLQMRVNGKTYAVEPSPDPIGYELRPGRPPRQLADDQRPDCSS